MFPGTSGNGFSVPITATEAELNKLAGMTSSTAELNILTGLTKTTLELNDMVDMSSAQTITGQKTLESPVINTPTIESPVINGTITGTAAANFLGRGALVYATVDQPTNAVGGTWTRIAFAAEDYDTDLIHSNVTDNDRLTVPAGVSMVRLVSSLKFEYINGAAREVIIGKNTPNGLNAVPVEAVGLPSSGSDGSSTTGFSNSYSMVSAKLNVVPGDYFTIHARQGSSSNLNVIGTNPSDTWFSMEIIY